MNKVFVRSIRMLSLLLGILVATRGSAQTSLRTSNEAPPALPGFGEQGSANEPFPCSKDNFKPAVEDVKRPPAPHPVMLSWKDSVSLSTPTGQRP